MGQTTGAHVIARALKDLGVTVVFGLVGLPVADIGEQCINLGIRFIGLRNEQSASYAATAYGYITGTPGVCLLVGGPGILHGMAGIGNASANGFPTLFLGGSSDRELDTKGAFQEMDAISLLTPHTKLAIRPSSNEPDLIISAIYNAYRACWYGRPGPTFVDLPADLIMFPSPASSKATPRILGAGPPRPEADLAVVQEAARLLMSADAPLVILGKGAAISQTEYLIRNFIDKYNIPFLPTPMGKGVVPDSHPLNASSARSTALKEADVILLLGARLNWILHYGEAPKYRKDVQIIRVDISAEELSRTNGTNMPALGIMADIGKAITSLSSQLEGWKYLSSPTLHSGSTGTYTAKLAASAAQNESQVQALALKPTKPGAHLTYQRAYHIMKAIFHELSPPEDAGIVYVAEGANTMDISRPIFPLEAPRQKLDAGTYATMGVGMGYAIAAWAAYNDALAPGQKRKKVIALEGDSAFGFSGLEIETMARQNMDIVIFIMNNSGIYHGDVKTGEDWHALREQSRRQDTTVDASSGEKEKKKGLRSTSLWWETRYEKMAEMVGGRGWFVRTERELAIATREAFLETSKVCLINVIIDAGLGDPVAFAWQQPRERL